MAGYSGYSMSNNAVAAYENGEKPLSNWTKKAILEILESEGLSNLQDLKKMSAKLLKEVCLVRTSWHHTSKMYNKTDFYSVDSARVRNLSKAEIERLIAQDREYKPKEEVGIKCRCRFLEWSGTRKHPKATEIEEIGMIKGNWFYRADGSKKKTDAKGFKILEKFS